MNHCTKEQLIAFEDRVKALWESGDLPYLIHLCGGNEDALIRIFQDIQPGDWVFSGHRNHYHALLSGMDAEVLLEKIKRGDSMFVYQRQHIPDYLMRQTAKDCDAAAGKPAMPVNFLTSAILASMTCIAAGVAWTIKEEALRGELGDKPYPKVWCFLGDGAEEQGHFYEAVLFAEGQQLPITFIIEDNNRSVDTDKISRRGEWTKLEEQPIAWPTCVWRYHYTPTYPHAGSGCQHHITFKPKPNL